MIDAFVDSVSAWVDSIHALGATGFALYGLIFLCGTLVFIPATPMIAIAGFLYGPVLGTLLISPVGVLSATLAFAVGRTLMRPWVRRKLAGKPRLKAIDKAVECGGFRILFLLRLAPIVPFAPLSYMLGASRIPLRHFILASWLGLLPGVFLYVYLGSLVSSVGHILSGELTSGTARMLTWAGLVAVVVALATIALFARRAINQAIDEQLNKENGDAQVKN